MKSLKSTLLGSLLVALGAVSLPGCLVLSGPPEVDMGEHCAVNGNCPTGAICTLATTGPYLGDTICLPAAPECTLASDPICGAYSCETTYFYCHRTCSSDADCNTGYVCANYDYNTGTGVCAPGL